MLENEKNALIAVSGVVVPLFVFLQLGINGIVYLLVVTAGVGLWFVFRRDDQERVTIIYPLPTLIIAIGLIGLMPALTLWLGFNMVFFISIMHELNDANEDEVKQPEMAKLAFWAAIIPTAISMVDAMGWWNVGPIWCIALVFYITAGSKAVNVDMYNKPKPMCINEW